MKQQTLIALFAFAIAGAAGCNSEQGTAPAEPEPAQVAHHVEEGSLNTIQLTAKAEQRLGIVLAEAQIVDVPRQRTVGVEIMVPPGQTFVVSAPVAGTLSVPDGTPLPSPGSHLVPGQPLFLLQPLLTPERDVLTSAERVRVAQSKADVTATQIDAERQVASAAVAVEAAQIAYDRTVQLRSNKAGSQRSVDEAAAKLKLAREAQTTAEARYRFLSSINLDEQAGQAAGHSVSSPVAGVLQSIEVAAGETVTAGEALFRVVRLERVWIRVPVYVGHWREVDTGQPAWIAEYGQKVDAPSLSATYVSAPPSANPNATTVDLHYELANSEGQWIPGQKLSVTLPVQGSARSLVVPFQAVLYDIHGGAWVYVQVEEHVYARQRVAVRLVRGTVAVLETGPQPGTQVVTDGAAELFGTEFGVGH